MRSVVTFCSFRCSIGSKQATMMIVPLALVAGVVDLLAIPRANRTAQANGWLHGLVNATVILLYALFVYKALVQYPVLLPPTTTLLVIKTILSLPCLGVTTIVEPSFINTVL